MSTAKELIMEILSESTDPIKKVLAALKAQGYVGKAENQGLGTTITFPALGRTAKVVIKNGTAFVHGSKSGSMSKALDGIIPTRVING